MKPSVVLNPVTEMPDSRAVFNKANLVNLGFAAIIFLMATVLYVGFQGAETAKETDHQQRDLEQKTRLVYQMREAIRKRTFSLSHVTGLDDYFDRDEQLQDFRRAARDFITARNRIADLGISPREQPSFDAVISVIAEIQPTVEHAMEYAVEEGVRGAELDTLLPHAFTAQGRALKALDDLVAAQEKIRLNIEQKLEAKRRNIQNLIIMIGIGIFATSAVIALAVTKRERTLISDLTKAKDSANQANRAKSVFLANISHELRTPLNAIIGFSQSLTDGHFGQLANDKHSEYIRLINSSGGDLLELVNDIIDLSEVEIGEIELESEYVDMKDLIDECINLLRPRAEGMRIALVNEIDPLLSPLKADRRRLRQVFLNIGVNAVKFTESEGTVTFGATRSPRDDEFVFTVTDTGIGMSGDDIPTALAPFEQINRGKFGKHEGSGLGLPLAKQLVELHGGNLSIKSAVGKGTTIEVSLPSKVNGA